jgi:hypothetical protein
MSIYWKPDTAKTPAVEEIARHWMEEERFDNAILHFTQTNAGIEVRLTIVAEHSNRATEEHLKAGHFG